LDRVAREILLQHPSLVDQQIAYGEVQIVHEGSLITKVELDDRDAADAR
jgi:hypothetical protein